MVNEKVNKVSSTLSVNGLNCLFVNARSVISNFKIEELQMYAIELNLHIIGVCETWLHENILDGEISLEGFTLYRKDRQAVKPGRGGGVLLYVNNILVSSACEILNSYKAEAVWSNIQIDKGNVLTVGVCYKSPNVEECELEQLFCSIKHASRNQVLVMGDFNYPDIDWDSLNHDQSSSEFMNLILESYLFQHVSEPTRDKNILDLVFTSEESMIDNIEVREHLSTSDHNILCWNLITKTEISSSNAVRYNFSKGDYSKINKHLSDVDWDTELKDLDPDNMWNVFCNIMNNLVVEFVPQMKNKCKKFPVWMTKDAKKHRKYKSRMWKRYKEDKSYNNLVEYKIALNKVTNAYKSAKMNFECKIAKNSKKNPKAFYNYIRSKSKTKDKVGPLKDENGKLISDSNIMSKMLNDYFSSIFTKENMDMIPEARSNFKEDRDAKLQDIDITQDMIYQKLKNLKKHKAPGVDNIDSGFLNETAMAVSVPLVKIFRKSLECGIVPADWKQANVCAIYKKGPKALPENYRPVSLTSHVCKTFESILKDKICEHIDKYNLMNHSQHGFVKNKSCLTNLLEFVAFVSDCIDAHKEVDVIYLDFQKAFDKVPHKRLLTKIKSFGIAEHVYNWIENWLTDRKQRVVVNDSFSDWKCVTSGVPQGSVLGPLLFIIYVNDMDEALVSRLLKFADDAKLFRCISDPDSVNILRDDLKSLCQWSEDWQMVFNVEKCKIMHFGTKNAKEQYSINNDSLSEVIEERDLGIIIQSDLKVSKQCAKVVKTANCILGMIKRSFHNKSKDIILPLYKSLVRPHLEYCVQAWRPHLVKDIKLIENVQHRATKMIYDLYGQAYEERLKSLNLTTLETRRLRGDLIEMYKILKGFDKTSLNIATNQMSSLRGHSLKLFKTRFNTNTGKYVFVNRTVDEWNKLSEDIISCNTVNSFKNKLDRYLRNCRGLI